MILTHESGSQEDRFDEKNGGQKSRDTILLNTIARGSREIYGNSNLFARSDMNIYK